MNDGTYEGILNQDDVQEYFNGDDARPFYPERAETVIRTDNGAVIEKLQKEIAELRAELEIAIHRAEVNHQSLNKALEASKSKDKILFALNEKVKSLHAENRAMLILQIGLRNSRLRKLFKCANAAKRQMRRERDAAREELESETQWAEQYHDDWIAARDELERVKAEIRRRKTGGTSSVAEINALHELERVKAELVEAQARLIAGDVYGQLDSVTYWKTRAEQAVAAARELAQIARDARYLYGEPIPEEDERLIAKYLDAERA